MSLSFRTPKRTDKEILETLSKLATSSEISFSHHIVRFGEATVPELNVKSDWAKSADLMQVLDLNSSFIEKVVSNYSSNLQVIYEKNDSNPVSSCLSINNRDPNAIKAPVLFRFVAKAKEIFGEASFAAHPGLIGTELASIYNIRDRILAQNEVKVERFISELQDFVLKQAAEQQESLKRNNDSHEARQKLADAEHKRQMEILRQKEDEVDRKIKELQLEENTGIRRKLRDDLKKELAKRSSKFTLTSGTRWMQLPIVIATLGTALVFAGLAVYLLVEELPNMPENVKAGWMIARQVTLSLAAVGFITFFIRWYNKSYQRLAEEEFRLKRLDLDIDRASWLVEMVLEWKKKNQSDQFPPELLKELARNLFSEDGKADHDMNPADTIASALFGTAANVKLKTPDGTEVTLNRDSIKKLSSQQPS